MTCQDCNATITDIRYGGRGPRRYCADCRVKRQKARRAREWQQPGYKAKRRAEHLRRRYGLTATEFDALLASQGGCAICRSADPQWYRGWHVDHDHDTGQVRGILCQPCNLLIGHAGNDPGVLVAAAAYLGLIEESQS